MVASYFVKAINSVCGLCHSLERPRKPLAAFTSSLYPFSVTIVVAGQKVG